MSMHCGDAVQIREQQPTSLRPVGCWTAAKTGRSVAATVPLLLLLKSPACSAVEDAAIAACSLQATAAGRLLAATCIVAQGQPMGGGWRTNGKGITRPPASPSWRMHPLWASKQLAPCWKPPAHLCALVIAVRQRQVNDSLGQRAGCSSSGGPC